jgi:prepilin-type N-terminal cleavage/methylation domain-containing protein
MRRRPRGLTLIEVTVSIAVVTIVILAAIGTRYLAVKQAVRADAYNTAGRIGLLLLEGWRSTDLDIYEPLVRLGGQISISQSTTGPDVTAAGFNLYTSPDGYAHYDIVQGPRHYYATLGYTDVDPTVGAERPPVLHVTVAFRHDYGAWDASSANYVQLTTYK